MANRTEVLTLLRIQREHQNQEAVRYLPLLKSAFESALIPLSAYMETTDGNDEAVRQSLADLITVCQQALEPLQDYVRTLVTNIEKHVGDPERGVEESQIVAVRNGIAELRRIKNLAEDEHDRQLMPAVGQFPGDHKVGIEELTQLRAYFQQAIVEVSDEIILLPAKDTVVDVKTATIERS